MKKQKVKKLIEKIVSDKLAAQQYPPIKKIVGFEKTTPKNNV